MEIVNLPLFLFNILFVLQNIYLKGTVHNFKLPLIYKVTCLIHTGTLFTIV